MSLRSVCPAGVSPQLLGPVWVNRPWAARLRRSRWDAVGHRAGLRGQLIGLVKRTRDPEDGRSFLATLTRRGLQRLREAQVAHHAVVRERLLSRLSERDVEELARIWNTAVPGVVDSEVWPPTELRVPARR